MSAPGVSRISPLRCAGALVLCAVAGAGVQMLTQPSATRTLAEAGGAADFTPSSGNTAAWAAIPTRESLAALSPEEQITTLAAALPQMEIADILPLVEHLLKARGVAPDEAPADPFAAPPPDLISPLLRALFTRWAALDAAGLMAYVESGPLRYDYDTRRLAVLALVEVRGLSALEEVRAKSPKLAHNAAFEMLQRDPQSLESLLPILTAGADHTNDGAEEAEALEGKIPPEVLLRFAAGTNNRNAMLNAMNALAASNFSNAAALAKSLPDGPMRNNALEWVLGQLSDPTSDYAATMHGLAFRSEYEALPADSPVRKSLLSNYASSLARDNPQQAVAWARELGDRKQRSEALCSICSQLPDAPPSQTTKLLAEAWTVAPENFTVGFPSGNPSVGFLSGFGRSQQNSVRGAFRQWHEASPKEAEAWLQTVTQPDLRALVQILLAQPGSDLSLIPESATRLAYTEDILFRRENALGQEDPDLPTLEAVPASLASLAKLHHLENNLPTPEEWETLPPEVRRALSAFVIRESAFAPADPFAPGLNDGNWLARFNSLPPAERSLGAYYEAGAAYINKDEAAASQWMESLPPGAERDAAATALVEHLVKPGDSQDGEAAFAWAAAMSGATERARYTSEAARAWAAEDPAAARTAVEASALPAAEKSALLQQLPREGVAR